jgi:hypothetical protein
MRKFNIGDVFYLPAEDAHFTISNNEGLHRKPIYELWWFDAKCSGAAHFHDFTEVNGKIFLFETHECIQLSEKEALIYKIKYA